MLAAIPLNFSREKPKSSNTPNYLNLYIKAQQKYDVNGNLIMGIWKINLRGEPAGLVEISQNLSFRRMTGRSYGAC
jgi:hypothetical protein